MEQGGMHRHTGFYLAEIALSVVLVLVVILFFLWNQQLNDQIVALETERRDLESQLSVEMEEEDILSEDILTIQVAGKTLRLVPDRHEIELNGIKIGSIQGQTSLPSIDLSFLKTTDAQVVGIRLENRDGLFTISEDYFVDPNSSKVVLLGSDKNWSSPSDSSPRASVRFGESVFDLGVDLRDVVDECVNAISPTCGSGIVYGLMVNGDQVNSFDPFNVQFDEHAEGGVWTPSLAVSLQGVSSDLTKVYFSFLSATYSLDEAGNVVQEILPDDLVTITDEVYE